MLLIYQMQSMMNVEQSMSLFIPRVYPNITSEQIKYIFEIEYLRLGVVERVDLVDKGHYNAAYIHFSSWYEEKYVAEFQHTLRVDKKITVVYEDPWFWIVLVNTSAKRIGPERRKEVINLRPESSASYVSEQVNPGFNYENSYNTYDAYSFTDVNFKTLVQDVRRVEQENAQFRASTDYNVRQVEQQNIQLRASTDYSINEILYKIDQENRNILGKIEPLKSLVYDVMHLEQENRNLRAEIELLKFVIQGDNYQFDNDSDLNEDERINSETVQFEKDTHSVNPAETFRNQKAEAKEVTEVAEAKEVAEVAEAKEAIDEDDRYGDEDDCEDDGYGDEDDGEDDGYGDEGYGDDGYEDEDKEVRVYDENEPEQEYDNDDEEDEYEVYKRLQSEWISWKNYRDEMERNKQGFVNNDNFVNSFGQLSLEDDETEMPPLKKIRLV
jgi:hypothetical protein